jgi:hypothetical protein
MVFTVPLFTKFTITQRHFQKICCIEFYPNRKRSVQNKEKFRLLPYSKLVFLRLTIAENLHMDICCTEFQGKRPINKKLRLEIYLRQEVNMAIVAPILTKLALA